MTEIDKKYELYKALKSAKWDELPEDYNLFLDKLNERSYFLDAHKVIKSIYPQAEESKLTEDEFVNYFSAKLSPEDQKIYEKEYHQDPYEKPWYDQIGFYLNNLLSKDPARQVLAAKEMAESIVGLYNVGISILPSLEITAINFLADEDLQGNTLLLNEKQKEQIRKENEEIDKRITEYKDKIFTENVAEYSKKRKAFREKLVKENVVMPEPSIVGEFYSGMGFTTAIAAAALVPVVGAPAAFGMGMSAEAMNLAADVYEGTEGNLDATKYAYGVGMLLGATEAFTPLQAVGVAKKGIRDLIGKEIKNDLKKEAFKSYFRSAGKEIAKEFSTEASQEAFQTWGEQKVMIDVGMQESIDWSEVFKAGMMGGITGAIMGGGATTLNILGDISYTQKYVKDQLPKRLDRYVRIGSITEEQKNNILTEMRSQFAPSNLKKKLMEFEESSVPAAAIEIYAKADRLFKNLQRVFSAPSTAEGTDKAQAMLQKNRLDGKELNQLDLFLISNMQTSQQEIPEFSNPDVMNSFTKIVLSMVERTKEFQNVREEIKNKTGLQGEALTQAAHAAILNEDQYAHLRTGYMNMMVNGTPVLSELESQIKDDSFYIEPDEKDLVFNMAQKKSIYQMDDNELERFIKSRHNKLAYVNRGDAVKYARAIGEFNQRMGRQGRAKRYKFDEVFEGEGRIVYKVESFEAEGREEQVDLFQKSEGNPEGINISSYEDGLGGQLTNFAKIPVKFKGVTYPSSEAAYQAEKAKLSSTDDKSVLRLMIDVITAKLEQHPELVQQITDRGGIDFLLASSHNLIKAGRIVKEDRWTGQQGLFMRALRNAYHNLTISKPEIKIISGGQTGIDRLGLEVAKSLGIETGGVAPKGYRTDIGDDITLKDFGLIESSSREYPQRTKDNVVSSDGTVLFGNLTSPGTRLTIRLAKENNKPYIENPTGVQLKKWIEENNIKILNIAGNRQKNLSKEQIISAENALREALGGTTITPQIPVKITASSELSRLTSKGFADSTIKPIVDWLGEMYGDISIVYDSSQVEPGKFHWNKKTGEKFISINPNHTDIKSGYDLYRTIAHEIIHNATFQQLRNDPIFRKHLNELYSQMKQEIMGSSYYEEHKEDLDRIFTDSNELDEFLGYVISNTSVLREWMATTEIKPGTTWLKNFYQQILDSLKRLFDRSPKSLTYLQALETLLNQTMAMPTTQIEPLGIPFYPSLLEDQTDLAYDIMDKALALEDEALGDVRSMNGVLLSLNLDLKTSPYEFVHGISKQEFYEVVDKSPKLLKKMEIYWDKKFKADMSFEEYKQKVATYVYNNIRSTKKRKSVSLRIDEAGIPQARFYNNGFKSQKGDLISAYHPLTMMDDLLPQLNELFGTRFEIVYLEEIVDDSGLRRISGKATKMYFELDNRSLMETYARAGIIFPGTFADKNTLIGLVEIDDQGQAITKRSPEQARISEITDQLLALYRGRMRALVDSGRVTAEYLQELDSPTPASIIRLLLEDLARGGKVVGGQLTSALFDPEYTDSYDAIKIFKRPFLVAPKYISSQIGSEVEYIVNKVVKEVYNNDISKSGLVIRDGKAYFRSLLFNDQPEAGVINIGGREVDLSRILVNDLGTPTTDGGFFYGLGGFDQVYKYLAGAVKQGAIKLWGGHSVTGNEFTAPFFLKTAGHGYSQQDNIIQWARDNNICLIIPASSVKINRYELGELMQPGQDSQIIEIPMDNLFRLQEKDEASQTAKGMQQTLTTNFLTYANEAFSKADQKKEFWGLMRVFTDNIIKRFTNQTTSLDKQGLLSYMKDIIQNPSNEYHKGLSQILSNMLITYADQRIAELSEEQKEDKELVKEMLRDQRLNNQMLSEKMSALFYHPYFNKLFEDYSHQLLKELLFYELPASYSVLTPDLGYLAQTRVALAEKYAYWLAKQKYPDLHGNSEEVQSEKEKILYEWIDKDTGRIKGDYIYYSANSAREHKIKLGDKVITGVVPSDSAQSIAGAKVIGIMNKSISETNKIVGQSELYQTQRGKDHDFDTVLVIGYSPLFGSRVTFERLADIFTDTKDNYPQMILKAFRRVLGEPNLPVSAVYDKTVRLRYMQALSEPTPSPQVHNPLFNQTVLNKYKKEIGTEVNKRKVATFKYQVGFKTKFVLFDNVFEIDMSKLDPLESHIFHLIATNAAVDLPSDDTALKYRLSPLREFDMENGTRLEETVQQIAQRSEAMAGIMEAVVPKYLSMFKQIDKMLFGYGIKISTKNNLDDFYEQRNLSESVKYMRMQKRINERLKTPAGREALYNYFDSTFKVKATKAARAEMMKVARQYIMNIQTEDLNESSSMYLIDKTNLSTLVNIKLEQGEYLRTEETVARKLLEKYPDVKTSIMEIHQEYKDLADHIQKELGDKARFNRMLFMLTIKDNESHILKGEILRVLNMFIRGEGLFKPQSITINNKEYSLTRFTKDLSVLSDERIFESIFRAALQKDNIALRSTATEQAMNVEGKTMRIIPEMGRIRFEIKDKSGQMVSLFSDELEGLLRRGDPVGKAFDRYFSKAFGAGMGKNRAAVSQVIDFSNTLSLIDRFKILGENVVPAVRALSETDKRKLLVSLLSYSEEANESVYAGKEDVSNDRYLSFLAMLNDDPVVSQFMEDYAVAFAQSVPHPEFTKAMDTIKTVETSDSDWEVWNMQSPTFKQRGKNLKDYAIEEKYQPYTDPLIGVSKTVDLMDGNVQDMNIWDVARITSHYLPESVTAKGDVEVLLATMQKHLNTIGEIDSFYKITSIEVSKLEEQYFSYGDQTSNNFTRAQELKLLKEEVADLVESNPHDIRIEKTGNKYVYIKGTNRFDNVDLLLDYLGITDLAQRMKHQIALKWQTVYSVENPQFARSMVNYLNSILFDFGRNSYAIQIVVSMLKRYEKFLNQIDSRLFHYYPRVYRQHIFETKIMNYLKVQEALAVEQEIQNAVSYVAQHPNQPITQAILDLASHQGDSAWILSKAKERVEKEKFNIGVGTFGKYVNGFSLKRDLPDTINGIKYYIRDSIVPHHQHQTQFMKMLKNDLLFLNWLQFQHKALLNGVSDEIIEAVKTEVATISGNRMLLSRDLDRSEILPGMEISFHYINDRYYNGIVDRVDDTYIYLKMDKDKYEKYLREKMIAYEQTDLSIQMIAFPHPATYRQMAVLGDLANQGYITTAQMMSINSMQDASTAIIGALKAILNDKQNWGRFRKNDLFRRDASAVGQPQGTPGVSRYMEFGAIEHLHGIARELDNTFDGQLSQGGFGEIISSGNLLPYLKYEMLNMPQGIMNMLSKGLALIGLSTPSAGVKNTYDGIAGVIRDRGFIQFAKTAPKALQIRSNMKSKFEAGEIAPEEDMLTTALLNGKPVFAGHGEKKVDIAKRVTTEISKQFTLENGLIYDDILTNSVAGNFEELFVEDERNQVKYKLAEKIFNVYKIVKDAWGYKKYRDTIIELEKELYDSVDPVQSQILMQKIAQTNTEWERDYHQRMLKAQRIAQKFTSRQVDIDLMKVNLAELHNKTAEELIPMMARVIARNPVVSFLLGTHTFKRAEGHIRRMAVINYVYNQVFSGETDIETIKLAAAKGVARTQALYDVASRRLGDRTILGRFMLMFGQYPYYMKQVFKATLKQSSEEGRKELKGKLAMEWYRDTVMSGFNFFLQGLRMGSPINLTINGVAILLLQALKRMDDGKEPFDFEDWDTREVLFNLLQFKIGMGIGIVLGTLWNMATGQEKMISIGRIGRAFDIMFDYLFPDEYYGKYENQNQIRDWSRFLIGINPLFPSFNWEKTDTDLIEHYREPIGSRVRDWWEPIIPLYPHIKYGTDF